MEFDPPSAMTRFGMFFLAGGVAVIFATWGVLKWIDKPHPVAKPPAAAVSPTASPQATQTR